MTAQSRSDQNASTDHAVVVAAMVAVARDVRSLTVDPVTHAHLKRFVTLKHRIISYDHINVYSSFPQIVHSGKIVFKRPIT